MSPLSASQVEEALRKHIDDESFTEWMWMGRKEFESVEDLGRVYVVEHHGGEGQGDNAHIVFKIETGEVVGEDAGTTHYFRMEGGYSSYVGFNWDGPMREVEPREKTVIVYEETSK